MNILILSAGTRNKIVQYFKKEVGAEGCVIATDCSNLAPAVYDADKFYLVPRITAPGYLERILEICEKERIDGVFSLIDPELSMLAKEKDRFLAVGTTPIISPYDLVETCFDKYRMYLSGPKKILFLNLRINRYEMLCACHRVFSSDENLRIVIHAQKGPNDRAY